ncbi:MAG: hypothetical protein AVDCRST_MAG25-1110 [uncultured Rubrobacteraceae bacterium]|uniref:Uncharacterized protein n=1 Tax=uncultured Rubrobacteraceae bacterium TaxID=349277 RepID=A0A6J4R322_9ACTN|nr:MAG: hypothetical protein AVDCRST_MAG25-1110 [uncultured Rubrobacteraceae bacterium]
MTPVTGLYEVLTREGARVVSPEQAVADPFATRQLADLGVKTERPGALGLARTRGSLAPGLIAQAGVFVQNLAPDAAGRLGCSGGNVPAAAEPWSGEPS